MKVRSLFCIAVAAIALSSGIACQSSDSSDPSYKDPTAAEKAAKAQRGGAINAARPGGPAPVGPQAPPMRAKAQ